MDTDEAHRSERTPPLPPSVHSATVTPPGTALLPSVSPGHDRSNASPVSLLGTYCMRNRPSDHAIAVDGRASMDFVSRGLMNTSSAEVAFNAFFAGCDRFVPIFDPSYDTFDSIRQRSSLLFDALCTAGITVADNETQLPQMLNFELKKHVNQVIVQSQPKVLETVQALLVIACYSPERSLLLSLATRFAIDIKLNLAFDELMSSALEEDDSAVDLPYLTRCSRTWFEIMVLDNMLQVDAGNLPALRPEGHMRRCRAFLQQKHTTPLDLRLLSQVELNSLRTEIHAGFAKEDSGADSDILKATNHATIDINLWYSEWKAMMESSPVANLELPLLLINLRVQKHWCKAMAYFRALKCLGTENVDALSAIGLKILSMAKVELRAHLSATLEEPNLYLPNLRFAMDFVWAKCAFCFLLVLKLTRLLPESQTESYRLLEEGNQLYRQMLNARTCAGTTTSRIYVQVLGMSIEKYSRALQQHYDPQVTTNSSPPAFFWETSDANLELQSFVPEQFVFEWNFPGLTLFSSPASWQNFFDDYLLGANHSTDQALQS
ncbi:uncharacterized protein AB675_7625 [Cyphellophora attinorum]|uniref:Transcription factor domain-containing protein n=1 Tax=Cyphellophora attinorum TaxID=1664694 RepID=A0A0N1H9M7_9EURO|nr:uncharacterized protein AB675_7625 [Phialophora attinorum]KPI40392.1 hypothetical protein AB675_7625 [Phialophora attinorum]